MHFASMSLGIFDFLINWLTEFIIWVVGWIFELINTLLAQLWFQIGTSFANILDLLQGTFKKLCGMDVYWVGTERVEGVDPLLQMFTNSNVIQILIALSLVAVVMVIIAAIIQVIRIEFTTEGSKNSKGQVFGQALKSLLMFFLVPICCIGGIGITNALLRTIDRATNLSTGSSTLGSTIFVSAATSTNRVRAGGNLTEPLRRLVGINGDINDTNREECAQLVDQYFKDTTVGWDTGIGIFDSGSAFCPYANWEIAFLYYNLYEMNYILYIGAVLIACGIMIHASYGMVMRLIKGVILFMVSPPIVALIPLTNSPFASWRKSFLANVLSAYGTIVGFNLVMMVLPVVNNIKLFHPATLDGTALGGLTAGMDANGANGLITILVTLTGLFMIKDMIKFLSDMINADDANAIGGPMSKKVGKTVGTMAAAAALPVAAAAAPAMAGIGAKLAAGGGKFAGLGKSMMGASNSLKSFSSKGAQRLKGTIAEKANKFIGDNSSGLIDKPFNDAKEKEKDEDRENRFKGIYERAQKKESTLKDLRVIKNDSKYTDFVNGITAANSEASRKAEIERNKQFAETMAKATDINSVLDTRTTYGSTKGIEAKRNLVGEKLDHGEKGDALELLTEMLTTLKSINAEQRTNDENELIVKLEAEKLKVEGIADTDIASLQKIAHSDSFKSTGELTKRVYDEAIKKYTEANDNHSILSNPAFNAEIILNAPTNAERDRILNSQISSIASALGKTDDEVKKVVQDELKRIREEVKKIQEEQTK